MSLILETEKENDKGESRDSHEKYIVERRPRKGENAPRALCGFSRKLENGLTVKITHGNIQPFFTGEVGMRISAPLTPSHFLMVVLAFLKGYHAGVVKSKENQ